MVQAADLGIVRAGVDVTSLAALASNVDASYRAIMMHSVLQPQVGWLQLAIMAIGLLLVYEVGYRLGHRRRDETRDAKKAQADVAVAAVLALLGLMLAFSFDIGARRYDRRKELVLEEAGAIATTYRRAKLVPSPYDQNIQVLLRTYVRARTSSRTPEELERAVRDSALLHAELWTNAIAVARAAPDSPITALFIASLNDMIERHEARVTVRLYQRIPPAIFASIYMVSLLGLGMVGLRAGLDRTRGVLSAGVLVASVICVTALIASLDDPVSRMFHVSWHALDDTERLMEADATAAASR